MAGTRALLWIVGLALLIRLTFVLCYPQVEVTADAAAYDQEARLLASGTPHAHISKGPFYPLFLAGIYRLVGHDQTTVRVVQAIISALSVVLIYALGKQVFGRPAVGLVAAGLASVYPPFISYTGWLLTETWAICLLLAFVLSLIRAYKQPQPLRVMLAGVLGGITVLLRGEFLAVIALCAIALWISGLGGSRVLLLGLCALLTMLPWLVRNALEFRKPVLVSPMGGQVLWISTVDFDGAEWDSNAPHVQEYRALVAGLGPIEADQKLRREAIRRILADPLGYLTLCLKRIPAFWIGGHSNTFVHFEQSLGSYVRQGDYAKVAIKLSMLAYNLLIIGLGLTGMYLAWRLGLVDPVPVALTALPVFVKAISHIFLFATLRYQVPILALLMIFAAFAVWHVRRVTAELLPGPA